MSGSFDSPRHVTPRGPVFGIRQIVIYGVALISVLGCIAYALVQFRSQAREARQAEGISAPPSSNVSRYEGEGPMAPMEGSSTSSGQVTSPHPDDSALAAEVSRQEQRQLALFRLDQVIRQGERTLAGLDSLEELILATERTHQELLTGEPGRRAASDESLVEQYHAVISSGPLDSGIVERLRPQVEGLLEPLRQAKARTVSGYTPSEELLGNLGDIDVELGTATSAWSGRNRRLASLVRLAPAKAPAGTPTLDEAVKRLEDKWAAERNRLETDHLAKVRAEEDAADVALTEKLARAKAAAQRDTTEAVAKANEESIRELGKVQADAITGATAQTVREAEAAKAAAVAAAKKAQLEREFETDRPEIERMLRPFLADGRTQPGGYGFEPATTVGPVSLGKLQGMQVLHPTIESQKTLYYITSANKMNDRDLGAFPDYVGGEQDFRAKQAVIQKAQALLIKYGSLMVEKKMLLP